jgi:hypothetical protein
MVDPHTLGYAWVTVHRCASGTNRGAAMQQISDWLQKLGLGQYAQPFAENDISFSILPDLTDQDLKELGVASLGHRRAARIGTTDRRNRLPSSFHDDCLSVNKGWWPSKSYGVGVAKSHPSR